LHLQIRRRGIRTDCANKLWTVDYAFHDYKTAGVERERLARWENKVGWETLLNRSGTTFRKLTCRLGEEGIAKTRFDVMRHKHTAQWWTCIP
jgi:arsenate reductase-like glutaredoxin family protein